MIVTGEEVRFERSSLLVLHCHALAIAGSHSQWIKFCKIRLNYEVLWIARFLNFIGQHQSIHPKNTRLQRCFWAYFAPRRRNFVVGLPLDVEVDAHRCPKYRHGVSNVESSSVRLIT